MRKVFAVAALFLSLFLICSCYSVSRMIDDPVVTDTETGLDAKMEKLGYPQVSISNIETYFDGPDWIERLLQLIEDSHDYILMTTFLASECEDNKAVYDLLCKKAEEGVRVYFVCDSASALDMTETRFHMKPFYRLELSGAHLLEYNPFSINRIPKLTGLFLREHRKIFIFDGKKIAVGGMNINYISNRSSLDDGQRDTMFCFDSPSAARVLIESFVRLWNSYSWDEINAEDFAVPDQEEQGFRAWIIDQYDINREMVPLFGSIFYSAKEEILILPLCPLHKEDTRKAISDAVERGVDVQMILPNDPRKSMYNAAHYSVSVLMETGMSIYPEPNTPERANLLHEKVMIVDGAYVLIGSANFNYRSLTLSNEIGILIDSPEFASFMRDHFMELRDGCPVVTEEQAESWKSVFWLLDYLMHFYMG